MTEKTNDMKKVLLLLAALCCITVSGQTYRYKRVMIVDGNYKKNVNDDAHYITFNNKGCYESDSKGYAKTGGFISFTKNENNLHCYYGDSYWGKAHYYFSSDYSRLNVKTDDKVYVYQRVSGNTSAANRQYRSNGGGGSNGGGNVIITTPAPAYPNGGSSSGGSNRVTCSGCGGTGRCTSCGGTGKMVSEAYYTDGHKMVSNCPVCRGTGTCGVCHGSGRL